MNTAMLKETLYAKLVADQDQFVARLKTQSPDEILFDAREYVNREDLLAAFAETELTDEQLIALLTEEDPMEKLKDLFGDADIDDILSVAKETIINLAESIIASDSLKTSIYMYDADYAAENEEMVLFKINQEENESCVRSIEIGIESHYCDNRLDSMPVLLSTILRFGIERVIDVVANTIKTKSWDHRFSQENRDWAERVSIQPNSALIDKVHPGLLNLFTDNLRLISET